MGAAEFSRGAGFADRDLGRKILVADPNTIPSYIVIDGKALATTPIDILTSTAMGQLRIAIETVYSTKHNPISDAMALHAISLLVENLPCCAELELDCLLRTKTAAIMASLAGVGGLGMNTAIAHHVGGIFDVPHGEANAILLLPHYALQLRGLRRSPGAHSWRYGNRRLRHDRRRGCPGRCRRRRESA